jgi:hypothetical protein
MILALRLLSIAIVLAATISAQESPPPLLPFGRSLLHAHNCYPEKGKWSDRIDRALATGLQPLVIEQDLALTSRNGTPVTVVTHDTDLIGTEPTLEEHFFKRVQPMLERALASKTTQQWPLLVLHLDFKTNEPEHHRVVIDLLKRYERFLTTAPRGDLATMQPLAMGPLLVLTENGPGQESDFTAASNGDRLLLFGSAPAPAASRIEDADERLRALADATPEELIGEPATNYRRWVNLSWQVVETGGQPRAGDWTTADSQRLEAIVDRGHSLGYLVRFYVLNGHSAAARPELTASYNFGSPEAVRKRWQAAIDAGVDLIATDHYEDLATLLKASAKR